MAKLWLTAGLLCLLVGCSSQVYIQMTPSGGDPQKGVVEMSYEYDSSKEPIIDYDRAHREAKMKCSIWGYTGEPRVVEEIRYSCTREGQGEQCYRYLVNVDYECKNKPEIKSLLEIPPAESIQLNEGAVKQ